MPRLRIFKRVVRLALDSRRLTQEDWTSAGSHDKVAHRPAWKADPRACPQPKLLDDYAQPLAAADGRAGLWARMAGGAGGGDPFGFIGRDRRKRHSPLQVRPAVQGSVVLLRTTRSDRSDTFPASRGSAESG